VKKLTRSVLKTLQPLVTWRSMQGGGKLFILIYHQVLEKPDFMRPDTVDTAAFTWQMELLARYFNVIPLEQALDQLQSGTLPPRAVSITFDDGYADNVTQALPILQYFDLSATFFIANGFLNGGRMWNDTVIESVRSFIQPQINLSFLGLSQLEIKTPEQKYKVAQQIIKTIKHVEPDLRKQYIDRLAAYVPELPNDLMMTSAQLQQLHQSGMTIGGHTVNHPILATLDIDAAKLEIEQNKAYLEKQINTQLTLFAYPNGKPGQDYTVEQVECVQSAGYQAAVATYWGVVDQASDMRQLPRFTPWDREPIRFMLRLVSNY
jgi:peptidoglycan/xylan/chitin deacetylase (PgdA/CDA1 family)